MTNQEILEIALRQSAIDMGCAPADFMCGENRVVESRPHPQARKYLNLPFFCDMVSYGSNIVASVDPRIAGFITDYMGNRTAAHCFETPKIHQLSEEFRQYGKSVCFMAEYFLPDSELRPLPCAYETRVLTQEDFSPLYTPEWGNALCEKRRQLDVLGVGAYDGGRLVGLAGCSADCDTMWQIGIDVLPGYRRRGIAAALTSRLAAEAFARGKVPFYCAAWSNLPSVRNALKSGFRPAWVELTAIDTKQAMEYL